MKFKPFPEIQTERLLLREIVKTDSDVILFLRSDEIVTKFIERPENRKTKDLSDAIKFIEELNEYLETDKSISWGITLRNTKKIIGTICLWNFSQKNNSAEVGYDLIPKYQNKGIMSEALKMIIDFGFKTLKLDTIEAFTHYENEKSIKLLEKNGFYLNESRKDLENKSNVIFEIENASS
ncbi:GNAT family N-acetyltransferase [uncultured Lutibacter sp.]|uniref:GNAT family N-acetyltransferase n=1 Tax=uncultured Lutibacter sp. TaxID=437739 RepID=UPI002625D95C|nr:GNAT family N-acetyltransferase [uncultured Lutibacter sp.]